MRLFVISRISKKIVSQEVRNQNAVNRAESVVEALIQSKGCDIYLFILFCLLKYTTKAVHV